MSLVGGVVAGMLAMVAGKRDGDAVCARYGTTGTLWRSYG